jgi:hypothetical protein
MISAPKVVQMLWLPIVGTLFLWLSRADEVDLIQGTLAFLLLLMPWSAYLRWRNGTRDRLPLFALLSLMYWLYYAVPLFWGDRVISDVSTPLGRELPDEAFTTTMALVVAGVVALWIGMNSKIGSLLAPANVPQLASGPSRMNYVRLVLVFGALSSFFENSINALGPGGRQFLGIMVSTAPLLAFAILFRLYLRGECSRWDRVLLIGYFVLRALSSLSSGWLGVLVSIVVVSAAIYIVERKRIPRAAILFVVVVTLFFQVGKEEFRKTYWQDNRQSGQIERAGFWLQTSLDKWGAVITQPSAENLREVVNPSVSRVSLLTQTANVIDQTPSVVPYQYGRLYSYLAITLVPRFIWPDKPSVNEANQFYQVAYGLTQEDELGGVSISVGVLTEGYMSLGWVGSIVIMFLLGIFFDFYQRTFLSTSSGALMSAIGLVLLLGFLSIESQMAQYLGGIVQQVLLMILVMLPVIRFKRPQRPAMAQFIQYQGE